jgi:glyoxylase-like metal-dependent hydrolase (beta-lactamase superfamily II)
MLQRDAAPGIHRIEDNHTNFYLVEDGGRLTIVDAGIPPSWKSLHEALASLGRSAADLDALILTHAHFDHIGFAERARSELGLPVWVHREDVHLTKHPRDYARERPLLKYVLTKPRALPILAGFIVTRGMWPPPVKEVLPFTEHDDLAVAGAPKTVFTPGHTFGHVAFHFPDRDAVIAGDAVVMLNPYTASRGPQLVARAAQADSARALASLDAVAATGARTVLTGHGEPWTQGAEAMVERARAAGLS